MSHEVVRALGLVPHPLQQPLTVRVANGQGLAVTHFVKLQGRLGPINVRLLLRMIKTNIPVVLGYPFLARLQPTIDWRRRVIRVERKNHVFEIPALPAADSYRITCPVVRGGPLPTEPEVEVPSDKSDPVICAMQEANPDPEVVTPTAEDRKALAHTTEPRWKTRRRLRNSPRQEVEKLIKEVDHTLCGPPCEGVEVPKEIRELNKEYAHLFPEKVPGGLPPPQRTDHQIDLKPDSRIPAQRLYRLAPAEDLELQKQLKGLQGLGFVEPSTSSYGASLLFVPKADGM